MNQMFSGTSYNLSGDYSIVGNPDLDAVRTISYEAGVRHRVDDLSTLALAAFYKQITGLVQTNPASGEGMEHFFVYENDDSYATVQGAEVSLMRLPGRFWSGSLSYTFSVAEGRFSSATEQYRYTSEGYGTVPLDDNYLDWDQRHRVQAHVSLSLDRGEGPEWAGVRPLEGSAMSLSLACGSGYPFSPASGDSIPSINTMRYPWTIQTDLTVSRLFWTGPAELEAKLTVFNLFDRSNVVRIFDPSLYMATGDPGGSMSNPSAYSTARHFFLSLGVRW